MVDDVGDGMGCIVTTRVDDDGPALTFEGADSS